MVRGDGLIIIIDRWFLLGLSHEGVGVCLTRAEREVGHGLVWLLVERRRVLDC